MNKWIFAIFGYIIFRTPGAILGFLLGSLIQKGSTITINKITQQDFELNLLALASLVIKADGRVSQKELDFVRIILFLLMDNKEQIKHLEYLIII